MMTLCSEITLDKALAGCVCQLRSAYIPKLMCDSEHISKTVVAFESPVYPLCTLGWGVRGGGHTWVQPCTPVPIMLWLGTPWRLTPAPLCFADVQRP